MLCSPPLPITTTALPQTTKTPPVLHHSLSPLFLLAHITLPPILASMCSHFLSDDLDNTPCLSSREDKEFVDIETVSHSETLSFDSSNNLPKGKYNQNHTKFNL